MPKDLLLLPLFGGDYCLFTMQLMTFILKILIRSIDVVVLQDV